MRWWWRCEDSNHFDGDNDGDGDDHDHDGDNDDDNDVDNDGDDDDQARGASVGRSDWGNQYGRRPRRGECHLSHPDDRFIVAYVLYINLAGKSNWYIYANANMGWI